METLEFDTLSKRRGRGRLVYFVDGDDKVIAKACGKCGEIKGLDEYCRDKGCLGGVQPHCKECNKVRFRKWAIDNREWSRLNTQKWRENNPGYAAQWQKDNPEKSRLVRQRRRARKVSLPDTLTEQQQDNIFERFGGCALTGDSDVHLDHVVPLSIGHGGTTLENMIPLRGDLNISKQASNIFEWFELVKERFNLNQSKFDELITYLAEANDMTAQEYRNYVDYCHDNPDGVPDELKEELAELEGFEEEELI